MNALAKARSSSREMMKIVEKDALMLKESGVLDLTPSSAGGFDQMKDAGANKLRYNQYKGWTYSAIHALAQEAAGQPVNIGRLLGGETQEKSLRLMKQFHRNSMTSYAKNKSHNQEVELIIDHPFLDMIEQPNPIQGKWEFIYNFVANINISGTSYIIADQVDGKLALYSLPSTWVIPDHKDGPFSSYKIVNPKDPMGAADAKPIPAENVGRAYFPNPNDPLGSLSPIQSQSSAIAVDEKIQTSQRVFFDNGIFPSAVVIVGKEPLNGVPGAGLRPPLTGAQRRMVFSAVGKRMQGVQNYGQPIILDGMIEKVERFSATQTEMGWEKSEDKVVTRILSAYAVHRFIMGDVVNIGGYAQAAVIVEQFCKRVNVFLNMMGAILTKFANTGESEKFLVWLEKCEAVDPSIRSADLREARKNGDITRNERRASLGFHPLEEEEADRSKLLDAVGGMQQVGGILAQVGQGSMSRESGIAVLSLFLQITPEQAALLVGTGAVQQTPEVITQESTEALRSAVAALKVTPEEMAGEILSSV